MAWGDEALGTAREHAANAVAALCGLPKLPAAGDDAAHRLMRLVNSAPAVIYSPRATGGFAPTFVSDNIRRVLGYPPSEHMQDPGF